MVGPLQCGFRVGISEPEPPEFQGMFTDPKEAQGLMEPKAEVPFPPGRRPRPQPTCPEPAPVAHPECDPLARFGILVPQSLRQAQGSFRGGCRAPEARFKSSHRRNGSCLIS
ncbi:coiled-coil domain-containing protein 115-like [Monodelphis domestica]|uniref:coiled-coil domain-containing protein 115-like n=1 Tax=Monodelphis domestica TaxID=13616 RepID=UPI0024E1EFD7|nr:coiled-coil domain-containing protein 115-like [Monodelphis domestica]